MVYNKTFLICTCKRDILVPSEIRGQGLPFIAMLTTLLQGAFHVRSTLNIHVH